MDLSLLTTICLANFITLLSNSHRNIETHHNNEINNSFTNPLLSYSSLDCCGFSTENCVENIQSVALRQVENYVCTEEWLLILSRNRLLNQLQHNGFDDPLSRAIEFSNGSEVYKNLQIEMVMMP